MSEDTKQAVVDDANTRAVPGSEADDARNDAAPDLDALLASFDEQTRSAAPPSPPVVADTSPDVKALAAQVQSLQGAVNEVSQFKFQRDMESLVKNVRGELDPDVFDDDLVGAWVDGMARKDPRLQRAWLERESNPKQFRAITEGLGKAFTKKFDKLPDRNVTEDREAVSAAVRGSLTRAPEDVPPSYGGMSNAEYRKEIREKHGFDPGV
jgi:hypothetical protein